MTATLLANELTTLISESKRKNVNLRSAADKSLTELKSLPSTSEQQLAADLSRRPTFIEPFLLACATRNSKFASGGIICLQRLVISKGLARSRLQDALEAFNACTDLGLDVQLKILQALPSLLQNYAPELEGDLLSSALQVCSSLQAVKASTVSGVASATLQQLVSDVFEKVAAEDCQSGKNTRSVEVPGDGAPILVKPAAYDAYRLLRDLALATEERATKFVTFTALSPETSLELTWSCIDSNIELFNNHPELVSIIGSNVFPIVLRALSEKLSFAITVRCTRLLDLLLEGFLTKLPGECEVALGLCAQALDPETAPEWKRALIMEVLQDFFDDSHHIIDAFSAFDAREGGKPVIQDLMSTFVRISTEKPSAIGLGHQAAGPSRASSQKDGGNEQATIEATGGVIGVISSAFGVAETSVAGISAQWSLPKTSCSEQLDKTEPPVVPETYIFALVLECLNGLSDSLARIVLPLTVDPGKTKHNLSNSASEEGVALDPPTAHSGHSSAFRVYRVPLNPLEAENASFAVRVKAVAALMESCWPAVLATSSTFLNAALDDQYFRNLIKSYQRFAQIAGLLRLAMPRDALMTTLAKFSVPPYILSAATSEIPKSPSIESPRVFSNPMSLLSVDSLVSSSSALSADRDRRSSGDPTRPMLTVRNLLCLRALLNLAIALGPTLQTALAIVINALRYTDLILSTAKNSQISRPSGQKSADASTFSQSFGVEVTAVEGAASRLLESTADWPNDAFVNVLRVFCRLLHAKSEEGHSPIASPSSPSTPNARARKSSGLPGLSTFFESQEQDYQFVIPKLGHLALLNIHRFVDDEADLSGWTILVDELLSVARMDSSSRETRRSATNALVELATETVAEVAKRQPGERATLQHRALAVLSRLVADQSIKDHELSPADVEMQNRVLDSLRTILERSGDSLIAGWDRILFIIVAATFEREGSSAHDVHHEEASIAWDQFSYALISPQNGRIAFAVTQLICSDFLDSLPLDVIPCLIELMMRFMCQSDDLNTALTTIATAWHISDFLFSRSTKSEFIAFVDQAQEFDDIIAQIRPLTGNSKPAQWLLLLVRLREVAACPSREIRNGAFQIICNVFKSHGDELSPTAWDVLLRCTILHIARTDSYNYSLALHGADLEEASKTQLDIGMSKTIITGTSEVFAQNLGSIERVKKLPGLWEVFLNMLERYLDIENHVLNAAVYEALSQVLGGIDPSSTVWKGPTYRTVHLWSKRAPVDDSEPNNSNQEAYLAYAEAGEEIYRLTRETMSVSQVRTMIDNLFECLTDSDGPLHGADVKSMSRLQAKVVQLFRSIDTSQPDILSCLVIVAAKMSVLHHENAGNPSRPTFVAVSYECIAWMEDLVRLSKADGLEPHAIGAPIHSLKRLISNKYDYVRDHKSVSLWKRATAAALKITPVIISKLDRCSTDGEDAQTKIWDDFSHLIGGVVQAEKLHFVEDKDRIHADETFDIESFHNLQRMLIPRLASATSADDAIRIYLKKLFEASLIHATEAGELPEHGKPQLDGIENIRRGRTTRAPPTLREDMSYTCFDELIALARPQNYSVPHQRLAKEAMPYLILRLAIPIRAYIADQPLRGRRPQPLSELEELLFCFDSIKGFDLTPSSDGSSSLRQMLMQHIYPLLIQAVSTASDTWSGAEEVMKPLQAVLAAIVVG